MTAALIQRRDLIFQEGAEVAAHFKRLAAEAVAAPMHEKGRFLGPLERLRDQHEELLRMHAAAVRELGHD